MLKLVSTGLSKITRTRKKSSGKAMLKRLKGQVWLYVVDGLIILAMNILLFSGYSASGAFTRLHIDVARYECYAVAFWHGTSAVEGPLSGQCSFLTTDNFPPIVQHMQLQGWPARFVGMVESQQSPSRPLHALPPEYPILSVIPFLLGLADHPRWYQVTFALEMALVAASVYAILLRFRSRRAALAFSFYLVVGGWATALGRFDLIPAGLTLIALLCAQRAKWKWAAVMLALATMFKLYPLVLVLPFFIAQQLCCRGSKWYAWRRWDAVVVCVSVCAMLTALSLVLSIEGTLGPFRYFDIRPIQIESLSASLLWLGSLVGYPVHYVSSYAAVNALSPLSSIVTLVATCCLAIGLLLTCWLQWHGKLDLPIASLVTLLLVIISGKVFSAQYLLWVTPLVAYIGQSNWKWLVSWGTIGLLTTVIYPLIYLSVPNVLLVPLIPAFQLVLLLRNVLMLALILALLYRAITRRPMTQSRLVLMSGDKRQEREMVGAASAGR
jgi:Mannosyltransferase (PIG-M)